MKDDNIIIEIDIDNNDNNEEIEVFKDEKVYKLEANYENLENLPQVNNILLIGNLTAEDLKLQEEGEYPEEIISNADIEEIFNDW